MRSHNIGLTPHATNEGRGGSADRRALDPRASSQPGISFARRAQRTHPRTVRRIQRAYDAALQEVASRDVRRDGEERTRSAPAAHFEYAEWKKTRVKIDYHIEFDSHFYSVKKDPTERCTTASSPSRSVTTKLGMPDARCIPTSSANARCTCTGSVRSK